MPRVNTTSLEKRSNITVFNTLYTKDELLTPQYDNDGIVWDENDFPWDYDDRMKVDQSGTDGDSGAEPHVAGPPELQVRNFVA